MRRYMIFILPLVLLLAACGAPEATVAPRKAPTAALVSKTDDPCAAEALQGYRNKYTSVIDRWGSALLVAGQSKADELQAPITSLQKIVDELGTIQPPPCAADAHAESIAAMKMSIGGYEDLQAKKDVGSTLQSAIDKLALARAKVAALPGTPIPLPTPLPTLTPMPTLTPIPTAAPTATPVPTATPEPRQAVMASRTQMYETSTSTAAVKTLAKETPVLIFETQKGRIHIRVDGMDGWVSSSSIIIK